MAPSELQQYQQHTVAVNTVNAINTATKTRFIGKHSRDNRLSIFLHQRNSNTPTELLGLVRVNRDALHLIQEKGATVVVGVMARLLCDHGLQFSEHFVYQKETAVYPPRCAVSCSEIELVESLLGDAVLPDEFHRGFKINLPAALPPSCIFLSPDTALGPGITGDSPWGLTYYLYAYLNTQPHSRKSSKVFLSFTRALPSQPSQLANQPPPAASVSKSSTRLLGSNKALSLHAALDRSFFYTDELMAVHVKIDNPRAVSYTGIRITLKQLITTRALNQSKQIIKVPLAAYEFSSVDANGKFRRKPHESFSSALNPKDFPFIIDTIRINLKLQQGIQHAAVESLLPRNSITSLVLCPTFSQTYEMQDNPLKYFAVEYYMNVHVVMPWGTNLIAKLPFIVASRGVPDSEFYSTSAGSIDNLASFDPGFIDKEDDKMDEKLEQVLEPERPKPRHVNISTTSAPVNVDYKIVKCDMERALKLLEQARNFNTQSIPSQSAAFERTRRTWVREFADSLKAINSFRGELDNLMDIVATGQGRKYQSGFPVEMIQELSARFIPLYLRFQHCHASSDHVQLLQESLNQSLDTLELILMKFHLLAHGGPTEDASEICVDDLDEVLRRRLPREMDKLTLVIPGMIEWRWLLDESHHYSTLTQENTGYNNTSDSAVEMANLFQSIHSRLTEPFSDSQIKPAEIFKYAQLLFNTEQPPSSAAAKAHYSYFKLALLIYYGHYPKLFHSDDDEYADGGDLKRMRDKLVQLRQDLIQSMIQ